MRADEFLRLTSDADIEKTIYENPSVSIVIFVKYNDSASRKALKTIKEFLTTDFPAQEILFLVADVSLSENFAKSLRISIAPTTVVFKGKQKIYEKICQPVLSELKDTLIKEIS